MKNQIKTHFSGNHLQFYDRYLQQISKIGGQEFKAVCPFHDDTSPSFNFNNSTGQYYCHGCGEKGDIFHFYGKVNGLDTGRDFGKILRGIADDFGIAVTNKPKGKIVETYSYTDEQGKELFQVCRMEPKSFRQRHRDVNGKWIWKMEGVRRVLYNLPALMNADEVFIVEGEKDADNLSRLDFTATTSPMGAKKWRDEYNEPLQGKNVVLIPDNDDQGREHMTRVARSLNGSTKSLKWLELPDLPIKGDVSNWLAKFDDSDDAGEELSLLIDRAEPYEPPKKYTIEDAIISTVSFIELPTAERHAYLYPWLKEDSINLVSGWRGCGKTWFALGILDAVTKGECFGPWECEKSIPCLFLDGEMTIHDDQERIQRLKLNAERRNPFYIYSDAYASQLGLPRAHLGNEVWREEITQILIDKKIKLWVVDNLASLASGIDENAKKDWDPINQWLLELRFIGISTIMLHHVNKDGGQRGTSAREDNLDISIMLNAPPDYTPEDGARFICHFGKARVSTVNLSIIADTEFKLISDDNGQYIWTWGNAKQQTRNAVLKALDDGLRQKDAAETLGISPGHVSRIKTRAIKDGYLNAENKLTPNGLLMVSNG